MKSRGLISALTVLALLSLLATCSLETGFRPASSAELPADQVLDVARSFSGPFEFETLLPVALNLTVQLYQQPGPAAALTRQTGDGQLIVVSLRNSKGETLYTGAVPPGGTLAAVLSLPAVPQDVTLRLEAPGYEPREATIDGMVLYSEINRVMGLLSEGLSAKTVLPDADGDGVPDVYDADPSNPAVTFVNKIPPEGYLSVAFEDLYLQADAGDADYNDFLAKYRVAEYAATSETLSSMVIEAVAVAKLAGYNHDFGMVIDFAGVADAQIEYYDAGGSLLKVTNMEGLTGQAVLPLFESTKDCIQRSTKAVLTFREPAPRNTITLPPYDPYLYVRNTKYDIHLIGRESLPNSTNPPGSTFQDAKGFPWALLVPISWKHPAETQYIGAAYPLFDRWRQTFGKEVPSWYLYPADVVLDPLNHPPYPVAKEHPEPTITIGTNATYQLRIDTQDEMADPDPGDTVTFLSSQLPSCMQLDKVSGKVVINAKTSPGQYVVYFWSLDSKGASTISDPHRVQFNLVLPTINQPPTASFPPTGFWVEGAGTNHPVNGYYTVGEIFNEYPRYLQIGGSYILFEFWAGDELRHWQLNTVLPEIPDPPSPLDPAKFPPLNTIPYFGPTPASTTPTEGQWFAGSGDSPAPIVLRIPISGIQWVGNMLTGHYLFSDPNPNDTDASTFQWYRFANGTDTTGGAEITGATSQTYLTVPTDVNRYLRIQVTPVDSRGAAGKPILSDPLKVLPATS
jgi:LruC domain-containing protein